MGLWWLLASLLGPCEACHEIFDEAAALTGHAFLAACASPTVALAHAASTGTLWDVAFQPELLLCLASAGRLSDAAFLGREGLCDRCPEGCAMVLLIAASAAEPTDVQVCSQSLLLYVRAYQQFADFEPHWLVDLRDNMHALVNARRGQCAAARRRELADAAASLPPAEAEADSAGDSGEAESASPPCRPAAPPPRRGAAAPEVAVLMAATPSMLKVYQPFINLWRCYALRHGLGFILETDDVDVSYPNQRAPNWMRWFAARRYIHFYSALLVVDPDQFVVPECWGVSIPALLGARAGPAKLATRGEEATLDAGLVATPAVATRDFGRPQTLNNGLALIRNSSRGLYFLEALLLKAAWMQTIEKDQGAFDETILEVLGLEARERGEEGYDSECTQHLFPTAGGNHEIARYALCWWRWAEVLAGPFGARRSHVVHFLDPRVADVNHVVGARGMDDPALLYHFAGRSKDWGAMLDTFGLERRHTGDCRKVFAHVAARAVARECVAGGPVVEECEPPEVVC